MDILILTNNRNVKVRMFVSFRGLITKPIIIKFCMHFVSGMEKDKRYLSFTKICSLRGRKKQVKSQVKSCVGKITLAGACEN